MKSTATIIAAAAVVLASCGGGGNGASTTTPPATVTPPTVTTPVTTPAPSATSAAAPATEPLTVAPTVPATALTPPQTTPAPATAPPTTTPPTAAPCVPFGGTDPVQAGFGPAGLSTLVGTDIRTGAHDCFERVVIELGGTGAMPGYLVRYATGDITLGETGDQYVDLRGDAELLVVVQSWMGSMEDGTTWGEQQIFPTNVTHIRELYLVENWEGQMAWGVGLDRERAFRVSTLTGPPRIVIDVVS